LGSAGYSLRQVFGSDAAERDQAIAAAEQVGVKLVIDHVRRFDVGHVEARRMIETGLVRRSFVRAFNTDVDLPLVSLADPAVSGGLILNGM
jgi:predicted dehydrogenase